MAFRRKCSDDSVLSKALLMSAMLMTESWATEVSPWPQCVKVVPQDKQHSWHTLHSKELAVAFCSRCEVSFSNETVPMWRTVDAVLRKRSVLGVYARAGSGREISKNDGRPRTKNRKCHDISLRTLRREISTRRGHFPGRSS